MNDRQEALDQFATQSVTDAQTLVPATMTFAPPPALVHGAQVVIVPRDVQKVLRNINALASAAGPDWYYSIPFRDRRTGQTKYVEGPSIKLANDIARLYGSCEINPWVSGEGLDYWEFTARFIDLESGYAMTRVFRQRKDAAKIGGGNEAAGRNMEAAFSIGISKAIRNVIVNALQTYSDYAYEQARNALVDKIGHDIEKWRKETSERIGRMVDIKRVEAVMGRPVKDWLARDIAQVVAMGKAIVDGMSTVDEMFPAIERQEHGSTEEQLNEASGSGDATQPETGAADGTEAESRIPADGATSSAAAPDVNPKLRKEATDKMLTLAMSETMEQQPKLEALEDAAGMWSEHLDREYFDQLVKTCVQVAKGFMTEKDARKTLGTIK